MKHLPLVIAALRRKPARTLLTMLGVAVAFLLFGLLQGVSSAFEVTLGRMKLDRLFVDSRFAQPMPLSYRAQIEQVPGVTRITEISFMVGQVGEPTRGVLVIATNPADWLGMRTDYTIPPEQVESALRTREGVIVTDWMARTRGWKVGDRFTLRSRATPTTPGADWSFVVAGIMTYVDSTEELSLMLANFSYYDEGRSRDKGTANRFLVGIDDPRHGARVSEQVDALFETSGIPTRTQSEQEMGQAQLANVGDARFFTRSIMAAVFFTLLILTGNTMLESVRERTLELAVLKALGYSDGAVMALVVAEAVLMCAVASLLGLALAALAFPLAEQHVALVELQVLPPVVYVFGATAAVAVALVSSLVPAWRITRLSVVDAFARR